MGRSSQSHLRAREGYDSAGDRHYPGSDYTYDWAGTWPSGSGSLPNPGDLFGPKDSGVFYPFTPGTVFKDSTLAAELSPGDPVGYVLDQSGEQTGDDLVTNGGFDSDLSGWDADPDWSWDNGVARCSGAQSSNSELVQQILTSSVAYEITFTVTERTAGTMWVVAGGRTGPAVTKAGTYTHRIDGNGTAFRIRGNNSFAGAVDNVSCKEVAANDLEQTDVDKQPIYTRHPKRGVVNLQNETIDFNDWVGANGASYTALGNGEIECIMPAASNGTVQPPLGNEMEAGTYTISALARSSGGADFMRFYAFDGVNQQSADLAISGTWTRVSWTVTLTSQSRISFRNASDAAARTFFAKEVQVEAGTEITPYQARVSEYDVAETGQTDCYGLTFDGVNDKMVSVKGHGSIRRAVTGCVGVVLPTHASDQLIYRFGEGRQTRAYGTIAGIIRARSTFGIPIFMSGDSYPVNSGTVVSHIVNADAPVQVMRQDGVETDRTTDDMGANPLIESELIWMGELSDVAPCAGTIYATTLIDRELTAAELVAVEEWTVSYTPEAEYVSAPEAGGNLVGQAFAEDTGVQTYDTSFDFTGGALVYSINSVTGVTINSATGVVSFDTGAMDLQTGTVIIVTATNSLGSDQSGFSLDVVWKVVVGATSGNEAEVLFNPIVPDETSADITISGTANYDGVYTVTAGEIRNNAYNFTDTTSISSTGVAVDDVATVDLGLWSTPTTSFTLSQQWKRDAAIIGGATGLTYTITAADGGTTLTAAVTGNDGTHTPVEVTSNGIDVVAGGGDVPVLITATPVIGAATVSIDISSVPDGEKVYFLIGASQNSYGAINSVTFDGNATNILVSGNTVDGGMRVESVIAEHTKLSSDSGPLTLSISGSAGITACAVMAVQADGWDNSNTDAVTDDTTGVQTNSVTASNPGVIFSVVTDRGGGGAGSLNYTVLPAGVTQVGTAPMTGTYDATFAVGSTSTTGATTLTAAVDSGSPDMSMSTVALTL